MAAQTNENLDNTGAGETLDDIHGEGSEEKGVPLGRSSIQWRFGALSIRPGKTRDS